MAYDPAVPLMDPYTPNKPRIQKRIHAPPVYRAAIFTIAWTRKLPRRPSTEKWIKKMRSTQTEEYYSALKKNEVSPFATTRMGLAMITLSE